MVFQEIANPEAFRLMMQQLINEGHQEIYVGFMQPSEKRWYQLLHDWCQIFLENPPVFLMVDCPVVTFIEHFNLIFVHNTSQQPYLVEFFKNEEKIFSVGDISDVDWNEGPQGIGPWNE